MNFAEKHIPEGQFHFFLDIVSYLQFVTGYTVSTEELQRDEVRAAKVHNTKEQYIVFLAFKTDVPPILGGLG